MAASTAFNSRSEAKHEINSSQTWCCRFS